jgi:hypothetical protein
MSMQPNRAKATSGVWMSVRGEFLSKLVIPGEGQGGGVINRITVESQIGRAGQRKILDSS